MAHPSLVPSLHEDVHFVLCDFGRAGLAYIETDPADADATTIVQNLLNGHTNARCGSLRSMRMKAGRETCQWPSPPRSGMLPSTKAVS
jgi:hypothetical protein